MRAFFNEKDGKELEEIRIDDFHVGAVNGAVRFFIKTEKGIMAVLLDDDKEQAENMRQYKEVLDRVLIYQLDHLTELLKKMANDQMENTPKDSVTFVN